MQCKYLTLAWSPQNLDSQAHAKTYLVQSSYLAFEITACLKTQIINFLVSLATWDFIPVHVLLKYCWNIIYVHLRHETSCKTKLKVLLTTVFSGRMLNMMSCDSVVHVMWLVCHVTLCLFQCAMWRCTRSTLTRMKSSLATAKVRQLACVSLSIQYLTKFFVMIKVRALRHLRDHVVAFNSSVSNSAMCFFHKEIPSGTEV